MTRDGAQSAVEETGVGDGWGRLKTILLHFRGLSRHLERMLMTSCLECVKRVAGNKVVMKRRWWYLNFLFEAKQ